MAEGRELPPVISKTHRRFRTPYVAILITVGVMLVLTLWSTFTKQLTLSVIARLLSYGLTCAALPVLRRKGETHPAMFKAPAGIAVSIVALALAVWLLSNSTWRDAQDSMIAAVIGLLIYFAYRAARGKETGKDSG
jgi:amino acid transporter